MKEKVEGCLKMLAYLNQDTFPFCFRSDGGSGLPKPINKGPFNTWHKFALRQDGLLNYYSHTSSTEHAQYWGKGKLKTDKAHLESIEPTKEIIDCVQRKLQNACFNKAQNKVLLRMVAHQLKCDGLEFLLADERTLH